MSGDDREFSAKLTTYLDQGVAELRPGVAYRLQQARAEALAQLSGETAGLRGTAREPALAGAGGGSVGGSRGGRPLFARVRPWIVALIVGAAVYGWQQWSTWQELEALEDLDAQILASDLPVDAYVDRGFQQWLKKSQALPQ